MNPEDLKSMIKAAAEDNRAAFAAEKDEAAKIQEEAERKRKEYMRVEAPKLAQIIIDDLPRLIRKNAGKKDYRRSDDYTMQWIHYGYWNEVWRKCGASDEIFDEIRKHLPEGIDINVVDPIDSSYRPARGIRVTWPKEWEE